MIQAMQRTLILDCNSKVGETVKIEGFIQTRRDHGRILFLDVSDRSGLIQVVVSQATHLGGEIAPQDAVSITGKVQKRPENLINKNIPTGSIEISAEKIEILSVGRGPFVAAYRQIEFVLPIFLRIFVVSICFCLDWFLRKIKPKFNFTDMCPLGYLFYVKK